MNNKSDNKLASKHFYLFVYFASLWYSSLAIDEIRETFARVFLGVCKSGA